MAIIFVFIDGIGLDNAHTHNPFARVPQPHLQALLGGPLISDSAIYHANRRVLLKPIDATLGVPGLPQSGTGQTALFAGINAAQSVQRHQTHFPPTALHDTLRQQSILQRGRKYGTSAFANAFDEGFWQAIDTRKLRKSASVIAAEGAEVRFRTQHDLAVGDALSWDITNHVMHQRHADLIAPIDAYVAGVNLAKLAHQHVITLYETFLTDLVGHGRTDVDVTEVVTRIDRLVGGIVSELRPQDSLVISIDHGNFERPHEKSHTTNPVPLLVVGPACDTLHHIHDISQVADALEVAMTHA
jgi:2,3-bisphosphoglycerate-independent phosphoglycerate mutase